MAQVTLDGPTTGYTRKVKIGTETYNFSTRVVYESNISGTNPITGAQVQVPNSGTAKITQLYSPKPNVWVTSAELGVDGKWKPLKKSESKDLLGNPYYPSSEGDQYVLGPSALKGLTLSGPNTLNNVSVNDGKVLYKKYTGLSDQQVNMEFNISSNIVPTGSAPPPSLFGSSSSPSQPQSQLPLPDPKNIQDPTIKSKGTRQEYDNYFYPNNIRGNRQDFIQFIAYEYIGRDLNIGKSSNSTIDPNLGFNPRNFGNPLGSVTLPIQPSISDTNSVQWGGEELNSLQAYAASVSYNAMSDIAGTGARVLTDLDKIFKNTDNNNVSNAVRLFLAGKAVGVNGLLSRIGGAVINPNLELLFQGPQLRPFNFTFRLSPRDETEAQQVKYIIRYFKQNMSVKNTDYNLFLKAPNVFKIKYHLAGSDKDHPSLNRFKMCALQSCSVDYTPDGSYMTFNDPTATMTSYSLTLQFQELEPVTEKDYNDLNDPTAIGY